MKELNQKLGKVKQEGSQALEEEKRKQTEESNRLKVEINQKEGIIESLERELKVNLFV